MPKITLLDQSTINKIAAGEVIERPSAVVKELIENAIDAGANAITVEIKDGGLTLIRITDNGTGIARDEIELAFMPHATSKIKSAEDLLSVSSLGFRGEALASIAAVTQLELITKTAGELTGTRYVIEGGTTKNREEIGCPEGTTFLVHNLFYNTPARRKFLKTPQTEAGYISELIERMAVSHPNISFKFLNNNQMKLHTSGNDNLKDIIYHIFGRDIAANLLSVEKSMNQILVKGYVGKPSISRGNRNYMSYFINGRYIKNTLIHKAIMDAYKPYTMSLRYPFAVLHFQIDASYIDVNVHPAKMEIRFTNSEEIYQLVFHSVSEALKEKELIPEIAAEEKKIETVPVRIPVPEPFEKQRREEEHSREPNELFHLGQTFPTSVFPIKEDTSYQAEQPAPAQQINLFEDKLLSPLAVKEHRIIGQLFLTYWIIEYKDKMFIIDQHAAHEKVLFEKLMKQLKNREYSSQAVLPPIILSLSMREEELLHAVHPALTEMGFEIESFGGNEYSVRAVPGNLPQIAQKELLLEMLDGLVDTGIRQTPDLLLEKVASMSCKAAVKGNNRLSFQEAEALIGELLELENPYHCPHGRPTIISMSKYEIEKKFKRIV